MQELREKIRRNEVEVIRALSVLFFVGWVPAMGLKMLLERTKQDRTTWRGQISFF